MSSSLIGPRTLVKYEAIDCFAAHKPSPPDWCATLASTGDTLTRKGVVFMWWIGDDLYATIGNTPHACMWAGKVCEALGIGSAFEEPPLRYNGRPIGQDEVIKVGRYQHDKHKASE